MASRSESGSSGYRAAESCATGVAIKINANPYRLDLDWRYCRYALEKGGGVNSDDY